ncbi:SDR family oxidoreductase [Goodfellowiella coeruleoviolacea]|uniref:NAD(P)-dependent dehydrogenase, short-chain alcohol dehydrogenase family n=1 Tax=Goodfellowiella coeruleoviolacea TaxID=334858 RepID=A0AAE3KJ23_9PSEU|nr:SDR family oxidoreductase [Goodfellowiella coeruleoviolacea]MCP2169836.1 NAD(P)-dependent dehydrogenase, short-chain alcohol dehydrogenase family [Goodfellowiella coeruleoviolacea]
MGSTLAGKVALVAGGTRGASRAIATELGRAGATVYVTGRTTRTQRSEVDRAESIEDTADLVRAAGGEGIAVRVDHLERDQVAALAERIDAEQGRLDILVNGLWGGDNYLEWGKPVWEHSLDKGLRQVRLGIDAHLITHHHLLPLLIRRPGGLVVELTDGTAEYNARYRTGTALPFYLVKASAHPMAVGLAAELEPHGGTAVAFTPGWLRSEAMLEIYGVTEENWRDACAKEPHFCISETPTFSGRAVAALAADPDRARWSGQTVNSGQLAKVYGITDVDGSQPDAWRYIEEVEHAGKPADATGYR